ncbi:ribonuclease H-like domain-containing protein [Tanacetum coccineum]
MTGGKLQFNAKEPVGFDKTKVECFNCHKTGYFAREYRSKGNQDIRRRDAGNTGYKAKDNERRPGKQRGPKALVTLDGDGQSGIDTEVTSCSKECEESYAKLKKLYDEQREQLGDASIEIKAYTLALSKSDVCAKDKSRLGFYGDQIHEGVLSYENEVLENVFNSRSSDVEDSLVNDRFTKVEGMHAIPPLMTEIYMPPKSDFGIDESQFTYGPKQSKTSESDAKTSDSDSCESNSNVEEEEETLESVHEPVYESDSDDEYVIKSLKEQETPSFAFVNTVKHIKTLRETVKEQNTCNQGPKVNKRDWNGLMSKKMGLGYGFTRKACFVCGSFGHLIRDCDFHEKRMAKHVKLNKKKSRGRPFNRTTAPKTDFSNQKVNTAGNKAVSAVGGIRETAVKTSAGIVDSGCSRHMTGNKAYLVDYQEFKGGSVVFGGSKGQITSKGRIITGKLDFEDLPDENQVLLRVPRQNNMYSFNLENIVPTGGLACLIANATVDESNKWHRRLERKAHKGPHVRRQVVSSISQPLQLLHMDLFGPTSVRSINHKTYCLVITDDFNRCDNGFTEFKNRDMIEFCRSKGIKREYSNARTSQQNGVAERKNYGPIEDVLRTIVADLFFHLTRFGLKL